MGSQFLNVSGGDDDITSPVSQKNDGDEKEVKIPPHTHKSLGFSQCVCLKCICMCMFYFKVSISSSSSSSSRHEVLCPFCCLYTIFVIVILLAWPDDWLCWVLNYVISYFYLTQWVMFCVCKMRMCVCRTVFFIIFAWFYPMFWNCVNMGVIWVP